MSNICKQYHVSGRVQGVWFRASTQHEAKKLGLTGWVRNLADGNVEALVCGDEVAVKKLEAWLHHGPKLAKVTELKITVLNWQAFDDFSIS